MKKVFQFIYGILLTVAVIVFTTVVIADPSQLDDLTQVLNNTFHQVENFIFLALGNGATTTSSVADRAGMTLNPKFDFGAKFDALTKKDGTISTSSTTFSSASSNFTSADTGKVIDIDFVGPNCGALHTTIDRVIDANNITLTDATSCPSGYQYAYVWVVTTAQSGSGSYAPNDTVTLSGGISTSPAVATIRATRGVSATVVSAGTGGVTANGTGNGVCQVQGTTGVGIKAIFNVTLVSGAITTVNNLPAPGEYTTNPTTLTSEPVVPVNNCTGLTGATLSMKTGPLVLASINHAGAGAYSVIPISPSIATTTSGAGTGLIITPIWYRAGNFIYGTDDTQAWINTVNASQTLSNQGKYNCIVMPSGASIITSTLPMWTTAPCIHGQARDLSIIYLAASFSGTAIEISDAWIADTQNTPEDGSLTPGTSIKYGTDIADFSIIGTRYTPNKQHGILFVDNNDYVNMRRIEVRGLNGTCIGIGGLVVNDTRSFTRESQFSDLYVQYCGSNTDDAFYVGANVKGTSDDLYFSNINIYASFGVSAHIWADGNAGLGFIHFDRFRIEYEGLFPDPNDHDMLVIGDSSKTGQVSNVWIDKAQLTDPPLGHSAIRIDASDASNAPFGIHVNGTIAGGNPVGKGLFINYGRSNEFHFLTMASIDTNVTFSTNAGLENDIIGTACSERSWTYNILASAAVSHPCYSTTAGGGGRISYGPSDGTIAGGNSPGPGSVNLSSTRAGAFQIPQGVNSASVGSANAQSTGNFAADMASIRPLLTGTYTQAIAAFNATDHGWPTSRILSGFALNNSFGGNQFQETFLGCETAATNAATCILTGDGTGVASTTDIGNPQNNSSWAGSLVCNAYDTTNKTNSIAWINVAALIMRQTTAASVTGAFSSIPTPLTLGTTTGSALTIGTDTTNGGMHLVFAAPTTNSAVWNVSCHTPTVQSAG